MYAVRSQLGKPRCVAGSLECLLRQQTGSLMLPVTIADIALPARHDDQRPLSPDDAHHVTDHVLASPLLDRLLQTLREAIVDDGREVLLVHAVVAIRQPELLGSNEPQGVEQLGTERVVSGFAAVEGQQSRSRTGSMTHHGEHATLLVVRMRGRVHQAGGRGQLAQRQGDTGDSAIEEEVLG